MYNLCHLIFRRATCTANCAEGCSSGGQMLCCCTCGADGNSEVVYVHSAEATCPSEAAPTKAVPMVEHAMPYAVVLDGADERSQRSHGQEASTRRHRTALGRIINPETGEAVQRGLPFGREEPASEEVPEFFDLVMQKDGPFGITFEVLSAGLVIVDIGTGSFGKQNALAVVKARPFDCMVKVNRKVKPNSMLRELQSCTGEVTFTFSHLQTFEVRLSSNNQSVGVNLTYQEESTLLDIRKIRSGVLKNHNKNAANHVKVKLGDVIVSVNGVTGKYGTAWSCNKLVECLRNEDELTVLFGRIPTLAAEDVRSSNKPAGLARAYSESNISTTSRSCSRLPSVGVAVSDFV